MARQLEGKVAVITGAGAGIGLATTHQFVSEGARVVAADVSAGSLAQWEGVDGIVTVVVDVSKRDDAERMIDTSVEQFGRLDILCNIAGIVDHFLPVAEMTDEIWERVMGVNLNGPFLACRKAIPIMLANGGGVIVNISSIAGLGGARGGAAYTASKHGVIGLTKSIAATYGEDNIRCVAVCPGRVRTNIAAGGFGSARGQAAIDRQKATVLRTLEPEEIANIVLFAASDAGSALNGDAIVADGAWVAH